MFNWSLPLSPFTVPPEFPTLSVRLLFTLSSCVTGTLLSTLHTSSRQPSCMWALLSPSYGGDGALRMKSLASIHSRNESGPDLQPRGVFSKPMQALTSSEIASLYAVTQILWILPPKSDLRFFSILSFPCPTCPTPVLTHCPLLTPAAHHHGPPRCPAALPGFLSLGTHWSLISNSFL